MMDRLEKSIKRQRDYIEYILLEPLSKISDICAECWDHRHLLDLKLKNYLVSNTGHRCRMLYAIDHQGLQYSRNVSDIDFDDSRVGQNLSNRPYLDFNYKSEAKHFELSNVYVDKQTRKPCITAIHSVKQNNELLGYIAADFDLKDLPLRNVDESQIQEWRQIKGDPSIRKSLFQQTRTISAMDEHLEEVMDVVESLVTEQGIFHAKLHFSSSRATLWPVNDPCRYRLHVLDEITNPKVCLVYAKTPYPADAVIPAASVSRLLKIFKSLRETDEIIYLRAASLNIMNGLIGLNFSCDGSHYMPADEFMNKDLGFWFD